MTFSKEKATLDTQNLVLLNAKTKDKWGGNWDTIAKAAEDENISSAKMSRSIKNKIIFNDDYYYGLQSN